jgi:formate dehydrogenase major subunit
MAPDETPDNEYPMILTTGRILEHWHTGEMTRRASHLDTIEPEAAIHISPGDVERLNVEPGETVKVSTRRGSIKLAVRREPAVPDGLIFMPFCFKEAAANFLTNPALDPFGKIPELKFSAVRVEKFSC